MVSWPSLSGGFAVPAGTPPSNNTASGHSDDPLKLGGYIFENFTAPEELPLGLQKSYAVHDFPGGEREVQEWGDFWKPIQWSGFLIGDDAEDRSNALYTLMKRKSSKVLEWRGYRLDVIIVDYTAKIHHRFEIEYDIEVIPFRAQNAASGSRFNSPEALMDHSFEQAQQTLGGFAVPAGSPITTPFELQPAKEAIDDLQDLIAENLRQSNGKVEDIDPNFRLLLSTAAASISLSLGSLIQSGTPQIAYRAADIRTYMQVIQNTLTEPAKAYKEIRYINPNLPIIASEEYGDANLWQVIAEAQKPRLQDQQLVGEYLLRIPLNPIKPTTNQTFYQ